MSELTLFFTGNEAPELFRTYFTHPLLERERRCVRGKSEGAYRGYSSFQWTSAVKALAVFFLRARLQADERDERVLLEGESGSLAASLDYAIGKLPAWMMDMFGVDGRGTTLLARIVNRTNPERKRPGPVALSLNQGALPPCNVKVIWDSRELDSHEDLRRLCSLLEDRSSIAERSGATRIARVAENLQRLETGPPDSRREEPKDRVLRELRPLLKSEIAGMLRETDIFRKQGLIQQIEAVSSNERFRKLSSGRRKLISDMDLELLPSARLGVFEDDASAKRALMEGPPLRIAASVSQVGAIAIFMYMKHARGYPIELNLRFPHSLRLVERIIEGSFEENADVCVLSLAPAAALFGNRRAKFKPIMMMPKQSYAILSSRPMGDQPKDLYSGTYLVLTEDYSNALFNLDALRESGKVDPRAMSVRHMEPDEVTQTLREPGLELRSIVGFPYYNLGAIFGNSHIVHDPCPAWSRRESFLFAHELVISNKARARALDIAIRDAWLELRDGGEALDCVVDRILAHTEYVKLAQRFGGLYSL